MIFKSYFTKFFSIILFLFISFNTINSQQSFDPDTVQAKKFDTGKMWTFDFPPIDYWKDTYGFLATEEWLNHVQHSTLRIPGCTASFVSEDGLIVTNHHCSTWHRNAVEEEGEDFYRDGFYAETLEDERLVPNMYADQLKLIRDVTDQVIDAINATEGDENKIKARDEKIKEIENLYNEQTGLKCEVVSYYNGGRYALHGYKRYDKVKLVFIGEDWVGMYGGDPDNFTYPRYNLDYAFFRIYDEDDKPLKTENYYKWNTSGVELDELLFIIGSPGSTSRLKTADQLRFNRDITYRNYSFLMTSMLTELYALMEKYPERQDEFAGMLSFVGNSEKVARNVVKGLNDPYLIARKEAFDKNLQSEITKDAELQKNYGHLWNAIKVNREEARKYSEKVAAYTVSGRLAPTYFKIAKSLVELANELKLPEAERNDLYVGEELDYTLSSLIPEDFDYNLQNNLLRKRIDAMYTYLGAEDPLVKKFTGGKKGEEAVSYILGKSNITTLDDLKELVKKGPNAILTSDDPFLYFMLNTKEDQKKFQKEIREIQALEANYNQQLGRALFEVYGTSIPPDATMTLRLADGVVEGFPYNGTVAPPITTFYGLYDRYYSFNKEFPWSLPERWLNLPTDFDLSTPYNFVSTNDIIGGNSGSPVINKNAEVVGLAFDGNIQGLPGNFIFRTEENRTVSVHSKGMWEAIDKVYRLKRLSNEIKNGKMD